MPPEPPANAGYMVAGYIVTALVVLVYAWSLWRRAGLRGINAGPRGGGAAGQRAPERDGAPKP